MFESDTPEECPLNDEHIREQHRADANLLARQEHYPAQYIVKSLHDDVREMICYVRPYDDPEKQ